jgi:hypothetical protein
VSTNGQQPELVTITVDDVEIRCRRASASSRRRSRPGSRSRVLLRAAARAARRRLPHVPLRGRARAAEAAGRLHADRGRTGWS